MIKSSSLKNVNVIGVDCCPLSDVSCGTFADKYFSVPHGNSPEYINSITSIVQSNDIDLIFPGSDEEVLKLSAVKEELSMRNCFVACPEYENVLVLSDKFSMLDYLTNSGIKSSKYGLFSSAEDLDALLFTLGFPNDKVIVKPRKGRGSKGVKLVDSTLSIKDQFESTNNSYTSKAQLLAYFRAYPNECSNYFAMEYLPGEKYSIDCLVEKSQLVFSVSRSNGTEPKLNPPKLPRSLLFFFL